MLVTTNSSLSPSREMVWSFERISSMNRRMMKKRHVVLGNGVVQLIDLLHLRRPLAVGLEQHTALRKDGDKLEA